MHHRVKKFEQKLSQPGPEPGPSHLMVACRNSAWPMSGVRQPVRGWIYRSIRQQVEHIAHLRSWGYQQHSGSVGSGKPALIETNDIAGKPVTVSTGQMSNQLELVYYN